MEPLSRCRNISTNYFAVQSGGEGYWQEGFIGRKAGVISRPPKPHEMPYEQRAEWDGDCYRPQHRKAVNPYSYGEPVVQDAKRYLHHTCTVIRSALEEQLISALQDHERLWSEHQSTLVSAISRTDVVKAWEQVIRDVIQGEDSLKQAVLESETLTPSPIRTVV